MSRFATILADPAWLYETWSEKGDERSPDYDTMRLDELARLPVGDLAADDAVMFLWITDPMLAIGAHLPILSAWGFEAKTVGFYWVKTIGAGMRMHTGMGHWTRANPETCILATRGSPKRRLKNVPRLIVAPLGEHSAKPPEQYRRIERLVGGPYLELFARHARPGWAQWGNEIGARGGEPNPVDMPGYPSSVVEPARGLFG